jgi:hypothetical protein
MAKVYVSSTRLDLEPERAAALSWLTQADHQPAHSYSPDSQTVRRGCLRDVRDCQAYCLILGRRYGFVPLDDNPEGLSITELEYRAARGAGLPIVALRARGVRDVSLTDIGTPAYAKVEAFARLVESNHSVFPFRTEAEMVAGLSSGLQKVHRVDARQDPGLLGEIGRLHLDDAKKGQMLLTQSLVLLVPQLREAFMRVVTAGEQPGASDLERAAAQGLRAGNPWPAASMLKQQQDEADHKARSLPDAAVGAAERLRAAQCARAQGALVRAKDRDAALATYLDAAACAPEDRSVWISLGHLYVALGRLDDAIRAFERAAEVEPTLPIPIPKAFTAFR